MYTAIHKATESLLNNSSDAALLSQSPEHFAQGIYDGILDYFDLPSNETPKN